MDINDISNLKKKKLLKDALDKYSEYADVDEDSDMPVSEKKTKEEKRID
ncbi:hypothetical protein H6503_04745 [Candidatus Woesearchaeota archaeon]|nr:hypothetical protein [Candidatus Woesearchaeota archaeon]